MCMVGVARHAPLFSRVIDTLSPISPFAASALKSIGVAAVGRYLENLSTSERDGLFQAGLAILPLSKAPASPLNATFGASHAEFLLQKAMALEVPLGVHVMVDFESQSGSHDDVTAYDEALTTALAAPGYIPFAYIGQPEPLSASELFQLPDVHLYWRGGSSNIPEPSCGFAMWQIPPLDQTLVAGLRVDMNITGADLRGRQPMFWYPT